MMPEAEFHALADAFLVRWSESLEAADASGALDVELQGGILTVALPDGGQYLVTKHAPTRQLWTASPLSGGLHFAYADGWQLPDGRTLEAVLRAELLALAGVTL